MSTVLIGRNCNHSLIRDYQQVECGEYDRLQFLGVQPENSDRGLPPERANPPVGRTERAGLQDGTLYTRVKERDLTEPSSLREER